jgi:hypothetical protein
VRAKRAEDGGNSGELKGMDTSTDKDAVETAPSQHRFERSDLGQAVLSALVSLILIIGLVWNLPDSKIKATMSPVLEPIAQAVGLEQVWKMYAPDVIRQLEFIDVQVTMADGSVRTWATPSGDKVIGPFSWYHWQKLKESLPRDVSMRADFAHWVVRNVTTPSEHPAKVQIVFRTVDISPPGQNLPSNPHEEVLYDESLAATP